MYIKHDNGYVIIKYIKNLENLSLLYKQITYNSGPLEHYVNCHDISLYRINLIFPAHSGKPDKNSLI